MTPNEIQQKKKQHKMAFFFLLLILLVAIFYYFKDVNWSNMKTLSGAKEEITANIKPDTTEKKVVAGAIGVLAGAVGYEGYQAFRDYTGMLVASTTPGAKPTQDWDCKDFKTQSEAQTFFINAGGPSNDTNRLDGNKDGVACQALPKTSR